MNFTINKLSLNLNEHTLNIRRLVVGVYYLDQLNSISNYLEGTLGFQTNANRNKDEKIKVLNELELLINKISN